MSFAPLLASVVLVLVALNAGALMVIRLLWPLRAPARVGSSPWGEEAALVGHPAARAPRWRWAGMLAGALGAVVVVAQSETVRGTMVAAPVFGVGVLAGALVGELRMPAPTGQVRRAELRVRRTTDYVPRGLGLLVAGSTVALAVLVALTAGVGSTPSETLGCLRQRAHWDADLWPGMRNTVPALSVVLIGLGLAALVLRRVVRRPRSADVVRFDDVSRRRSAEVVTAAAGVLVLASCFGVAGTAGLSMSFLGDACAESGWAGPGALLLGLALAAFLATAWCGAALLRPSARPTGWRSA